MRAHLLGHMPNLTVDIIQLQQEVDQMSNAKLQLFLGEEILSVAEEGLSTLNPVKWLKTQGGEFAGAIAFLFIVLCLFCLVLRFGQIALQREVNKKTARSVFLMLRKQKGGNVVTQQPSQLFPPTPVTFLKERGVCETVLFWDFVLA